MALKKRPIVGLGGVIGYSCPSKGVEIRKCPTGEATEIIVRHHYSGKATRTCYFSFKVFWFGKVHGALQVGGGIKPQSKGLFPPETTREFDRMWLSDEMPKYSETIVISLLIHYLRSETTLTHLISWSDGSAGNPGTIYKAANFTLVKEIPVDFYEWKGERIHPLRFYHRHKTRAWSFLQENYPGIKKLNGVQRQFVYEIKR